MELNRAPLPPFLPSLVNSSSLFWCHGISLLFAAGA